MESNSKVGIWTTVDSGARGKEHICQFRRCKRHCSIPGSGRSPVGGHSNPLQYSCLKHPMDRAAWWATVHWVAKNQTWLNNWTRRRRIAVEFMLLFTMWHGLLTFTLDSHLENLTYGLIWWNLKKLKQVSQFSHLKLKWRLAS